MRHHYLINVDKASINPVQQKEKYYYCAETWKLKKGKALNEIDK